MINLPAVLIANGAGIILLCILLINARKTQFGRMLDDLIFHLMVVVNFLQCFLEPLTMWLDGAMFTGAHTILLLTNGLLYVNNITFAFLWTLYCDHKLFENATRLKRRYSIIAIPTLLVVIGVIVNFFTPVFFRITDQNIYERCALFVIPYAFTYFYLLYGVFMIYRYKNKVNKYLFMPAVIFMIPIFIASILQFFLYGLSLLWIGVAIAMTSLYINVQNESSYIDTLSGLFSRPYMNTYLEALIKRTAPPKQIAGIMLDIDRFKSINDTYGHLAGDDVIHNVGKILRSYLSANHLAVRFAGDEFVIFETVESEIEVQNSILLLRKSIRQYNQSSDKPYQISVSVGYSMYAPQSDSIDDFLNRMDAAMYEEKNEKARLQQLQHGSGEQSEIT